MATFQMKNKTWEEISNDVNSAPNHVCMLRQEYKKAFLLSFFVFDPVWPSGKALGW